MVVAPSSSSIDKSDERLVNYQNFMTSKEPHLRVTKKALTTVATWCENHQRSVVLGDIPRTQMLYNTMQEFHLLDMQKMLREVLYHSYHNEESAYQSCLKEFPDFALHHSDEYMSSLVQNLCEHTNI